MSQIREEKQIKYFISYAGSCLKIWNSIIGQQITHYLAGPGTIVDIEKNSDSIFVKVQFHTEQEPKPFLGTERNLLRVFHSLDTSWGSCERIRNTLLEYQKRGFTRSA